LDKNRIMHTLLLVVLVTSILVVGGCVGEIGGDKEKITITDSTGTDLEINYPVEHVVTLTSDSAEAVRALDAENKIVGITEYMKGDSFWGDIGDKPSVGNIFSPNAEEIASLDPKPDIVITYTDWSDDLEDQLEPFGIQVVRLDFYKMDTMDREIEVLGEILDREDEADELLEFYGDQLDKIETKSGMMDEDMVKEVYLEAYKEYSTAATNDTNYHQILNLIGSVNIAGEFTNTYPEVSAEWVMEKNPDAMVKVVQDSDTLGYEVEDTENAEQLYNEITDRKGLSSTDAIKDGELLLVSQGVLSSMKSPVGALIIAEFLYPSLYSDIDSNEVLEEYFEDFHGVGHDGIWYYK